MTTGGQGNDCLSLDLERLRQRVRALERTEGERTQAEQALRRSEARLARAQSMAHVGCWENDLVNDKQWWSEELYRIFGMDPVADPPSRDALYRSIPAEEQPLLDAAFAAAITRGEPIDLEHRVIRADGTMRHVHAVGEVERASDGSPIRLFGAALDITERKKSEDALRLLSQITAQVSAPVLATNLDYEIIYTNRAFQTLYGYAEEELLGKSPDMVNAAPNAAEIQAGIYEAVSAGRIWTGEVLNRRKDGHVFPVELMVFPIVDDQGDPISFTGLQVDLSERKRAEQERARLEEQLRQTQKLEGLGVLAGGIAHDFNNLLQAVLGQTSLALRQLPAGSKLRSAIEDANSAARRAADLAQQMLAYSGRGAFVTEAVDLTELVEEMGRLLASAVSKAASLELALVKDLPEIAADAVQIRQVVMNLITNASEALPPEGGRIEVATGAMDCDSAFLRRTYLYERQAEGRYAFLRVCDSGAGMDRATIRRMFDPFFTTKFSGRGLGLSSILGIVRGHDGALRVESTPGKGTVMTVLFPVGASPIARSKSPAPQRSRPIAGGTVLVIDDEEMVRRSARAMLEEIGLSVLEAASGEEGLEVYAKSSRDVRLVLLDLTMPGIDGEQTLAALRELDTDLPVVLSSGYHEDEVKTRLAGKGATGFLQKPYQLATLEALLARLLPG